MKTTGLEVISFETTVDRISFWQHLSDCSVVQTVTKVTTDEGAEGYYLGWPFSPPRKAQARFSLLRPHPLGRRLRALRSRCLPPSDPRRKAGWTKANQRRPA